MDTVKKTILLFAVLVILFLITVNVLADIKAKRIQVNVSETCAETIENAVEEVDGVIGTYWEDFTNELEIIYKTNKTSFEEIEQAISEAGFKTPNYSASEEAEEEIPSECRGVLSFSVEEEELD